MKCRRGFSLLEVILASILITAVVISLMGVWPAHHQLIEKKKRRGAAVFFATREMELALDQGFDGVGPVGAPPQVQVVQVESVISDVPQTVEYKVTRTVTSDPSAPTNPLLKQVQVVVEYDEKGGHRKVELAATLGG